MSSLIDPLDVAFAIGVYINLYGGNQGRKIIGHQIQID
jgi:hypothetical protein